MSSRERGCGRRTQEEDKKWRGASLFFWRRVDDGLGFSFKGQAGDLPRRKKWKGAGCLLEEKALCASGSKRRRESLKSGGPWLCSVNTPPRTPGNDSFFFLVRGGRLVCWVELSLGLEFFVFLF